MTNSPARAPRYSSLSAVSLMSVLIAPLLLNTGCSSCPRDPNKAGFVCGVSNITTSVYVEDEKRMRSEMEVAQARATDLREQGVRLNAEAASLSVEEGRLRKRLATLNDSLAGQIEALEHANENRTERRSDYARLQLRIAALESEYRRLAGSGSIDRVAVERLEQENERLRRSIESIPGR